MRPTPTARHPVAVLIFAAYSSLAGYLAFVEPELSNQQVLIATAAIKRHDVSTFPHDPVLGDNRLWRFHTPVFQGLLELSLVPTGYADLSLPFRALAGVLLMVYLCGMYALLYQQCRSWSIAALVAVLSSKVIEALGGGFWGAGTLACVTPMGICLAVTPLIVLAFLRYAGASELRREPSGNGGRQAQWRLLLVFGGIGLLGNLHLVTAMNLTLVLLIAYLGRARFRAGSWGVALACGAAALLGSLPHIMYFVMLRGLLQGPAAATAEAPIREALRVAGLEALYPEMLKPMLRWLAYAAVVGAPSALLLFRSDRFRVTNGRLWGCLIVASLLLAIVLHGATQVMAMLVRRSPPIIALLQASALAMLPLYVLAAQALTALFRLVQVNRWLLRWGCAVALVAWMLPSDNVQPLRHAAYEWATSFMEEQDKPLRVQELHAQAEARRELRGLAAWARGGPRGAVFITDRVEFRMLARRSIVITRDDVGYYYYLAPGRLTKWIERLKRQARLLQKPGTIREFAGFRSLLSKRSTWAGAADWFVVLPADPALPEAGGLEVPPHGRWGAHYRVYRVPAPPPEGSSPGT